MTETPNINIYDILSRSIINLSNFKLTLGNPIPPENVTPEKKLALRNLIETSLINLSVLRLGDAIKNGNSLNDDLAYEILLLELKIHTKINNKTCDENDINEIQNFINEHNDKLSAIKRNTLNSLLKIVNDTIQKLKNLNDDIPPREEDPDRPVVKDTTNEVALATTLAVAESEQSQEESEEDKEEEEKETDEKEKDTTSESAIALATALATAESEQPEEESEEEEEEEEKDEKEKDTTSDSAIALATALATKESEQLEEESDEEEDKDTTSDSAIALATALATAESPEVEEDLSLYDIIFKKLLGKVARKIPSSVDDYKNTFNYIEKYKKQINISKIVSEYKKTDFNDLFYILDHFEDKLQTILTDMGIMENSYAKNGITLIKLVEIWNIYSDDTYENDDELLNAIGYFDDIIKKLYKNFDIIQQNYNKNK
jgi:hypothetical protein